MNKNEKNNSNDIMELKANINKLEGFLRDKFYKQGMVLTHTKLAKPGGCYSIEGSDLAKFYKLYSKVVNKTELNIIERPYEISPFLIDIDYDTIYENRVYKLKDIKKIIDICNKIITEIYSCSKKSFKMFVLEKKKPSFKKEGVYKDGFHIIYPSVGINVFMRYYILDKLTTKLEKLKIFNDVGFNNNYNNIVDKSIVIDNGITMYGSNKQGSQKYELTHIYNYQLEDEDISFSEEELVELMSNRRYFQIKALKRNDNFSEEEYNDIINKMKEKYEKKKTIKKEKNIDDTKEQEQEQEEFEQDDDYFGGANNKKLYNDIQKERANTENKDVDLAKKLANILSKSRASNYHDWIYVGWALHNISPSLLGTFKAFSKKCGTKYDPVACDNVWAKARSDGFGLPSLHKWAKDDNSKAYLDIIRDSANELFVKAEDGCDYDIAKLIYELYKYSYKCVSLKHKAWYEFQGNRWVEVEGGYTLNIRISETLTKEFAELERQYYQMATSDDLNGTTKDNLLKKAGNISKLISKLRKGGFKASIMSQCELLFYDNKFESKLDSNKDLLGFDNGVYDLENGYFREGFPDDNITFSVGYDYKPYTMEHEYVKEVISYFETIQRESDMNNYLLILLSSYLSGNNKDQQFIIWTGSGSNGKSKTLEFCKMAFGDYAGTLPIKILTGNRANAGTANPEIADTKGKRFVVFQEPENDDIIKVGYMKELSGSDAICARKLFRDPFVFTPQFKMILTCNKLPTIPSDDDGTWRRIRVTPFESEFIDVDDNGKNSNTGKELKANQFPKRFDFERKMEQWKGAFIWLLIQIYRTKYITGNIKNYEPEKVKLFTKNYKKNSDVILEFFEETYEFVDDKSEYVRFVDMYISYKAWFKTAQGGVKLLSTSEFKKYFINKKDTYKVVKDVAIRGIKQKDDNMELGEDNEADDLD